MHKRITFLLAGVLTVLNPAGAMDIHVSPTGLDTNSGSEEAPLASLDAARALIAARPKTQRDAVNVWVQGGTYYFTQPFHLGPQDSGTREAPITYAAAPGETVTLKGSQPLASSAWRPFKDGIYMQSLKVMALEGREINQLFMENKRMVRARFPNWDFENPLRTGNGYLHVTNKKSMEHLTFNPEDMKSREGVWKKPQTGIVHAFHVSNWGNFQFKIKDVDWANHRINFAEGGWQAQRRYGVGVKSPGHGGSPFYVENIFEELDAPFEWFHDAESETLYFKPPTGTDLSTVSVEAAVVSRVIEVEGAAHIHLDGFHLTQTRATFMDPYEDIARGDWAIHRGGAVYFKNSQHCSVRNFHIGQVGGNGIFVDGFNREVHISGCLIEDTGDSAVCFVGNPKAVREYQTWTEPVKEFADFEPGPKTKDYPANCSVKNSVMRDVGVYGKQTSGVLVSMAMDITVDHCSVYRIARAGVTFNDGTWGGHVMSHCDIYDTILDTGEHGPFNAWGRERFWRGRNLNKKLVLLDAMKPVKLHQNRVGNYRSGVSAGNWTIDLDDGSSNFEITNNLMLGSTLKLRDGYFRTVRNNIMVSAVPIGLHCWPADNSEDIFERNIVVVSGATEGSGRISQSMIGPAVMPDDYGVWGQFDSNLWWNTNAQDFSVGNLASSLQQWQEKQGEHSVFGNPMFIDPLNRDFRVKPESPAMKLGFQNFSMDQFGHQMTRIMVSESEFTEEIEVAIRADARGGQIRYTLDGTEPTMDSLLYESPLTIRSSVTVCANTFDTQGHAVGFSDVATLTKVDEVQRQSWLASLQARSTVESLADSVNELPKVSGRFVRIELPGRNRTLSLAEVEVYENGKNVAKGKGATQINTRAGAGPERAVDGSSNGDYHQGSVTHTEQGIANPWWEVDLGRNVEIERIVLANRDAHEQRLAGFTLRVMDANRKVVLERTGCKQSSRMTFAASAVGEPESMQWAGMILANISDFPDLIDASGGQFFGAYVLEIEEDSKAAKAGFEDGDTIIGVGVKEVRTIDDLQQAVESETGSVKCKIFRGYKHYILTVQP